jgi:hypothetical protein
MLFADASRGSGETMAAEARLTFARNVRRLHNALESIGNLESRDDLLN